MKVNYLSTILLIFANLYGIYGVLFLNWDVNNLILLYFVESIVIGVYTIVKLFYIDYFDNYNLVKLSTSEKIKNISLAIFIIFFYITIISVLLNATFFVDKDIYSYISITGILALIFSHGVSFFTNFIQNKEYQNSFFINTIFNFIFIRILPVQIFIVLTAFQPVIEGKYLLIIFISLKILLDLLIHILLHSIKRITTKKLV